MLIGRFLVTAFFAVAFGQSALDKLFDRDGNVSYFQDHFKNSPIPPELVGPLFMLLTAIEAAAGALCALGLLTFSFVRPGLGIAGLGVATAGFALLCLLVGQRLAKDYAGAAVVAAYFAVALLGISLF
ncbi:MAG TPA: DoxX family protein [Candidatus Binatia bacterium]|nr:DoxX family protein [Candidatus Binatia bacterium]